MHSQSFKTPLDLCTKGSQWIFYQIHQCGFSPSFWEGLAEERFFCLYPARDGAEPIWGAEKQNFSFILLVHRIILHSALYCTENWLSQDFNSCCNQQNQQHLLLRSLPSGYYKAFSVWRLKTSTRKLLPFPLQPFVLWGWSTQLGQSDFEPRGVSSLSNSITGKEHGTWWSRSADSAIET